jgi:hypothetical protein
MGRVVPVHDGAIKGPGRKAKVFFFANKKEAKKTLLIYAVPVTRLCTNFQKVFWFFFSKKNGLLPP